MYTKEYIGKFSRAPGSCSVEVCFHKSIFITTNMEYSTEEEDLPPQIAELAQARAPTAMKGTRACKRCGIIKALDQFVDEGCENCPYLEMVRFMLLCIRTLTTFRFERANSVNEL